METAPIDLDSLNAKQRLKEYKAIAKDLKSKDPVVKLNAAGKLRDTRYLTEGKCLPNFLLSLVPKKKTIDNVVDALRLLTTLLTGYYAQDNKMEPLLQSLNDIIDTDGDLHVFQPLIDSFIYKEEVKPPKVSKKKNAEPPPPPPPENPQIIEMRRLGLKALYYIVLPQVDGAVEANKLQQTFSAFPTLFERVCDTANTIFEEVSKIPPISDESPITTEGVVHMQDAVYIVRLMTFMLRYNPEAPRTLASRNLLLSKFPAILKHDKLRLSVLQSIYYLSLCKEGLDMIQQEGLSDEMVHYLEQSNKSLQELAAPTEPANPGKGGPAGGKQPPKKDDKGKKGAAVVVEEVEDPIAKLDYMKIDMKRSLITNIKIIVNILIRVSSLRSTNITVELATRVILVLQKVVLQEEVWIEIKKQTQPVDEDIRRTLELACTLIGCMGDISNEIRSAVASCGVIITLQQLVMCAKKASGAVLPSADPAATIEAAFVPPHPVTFIEYSAKELMEITLSLRRYAEKAIFSLLADGIEVSSTGNTRWISCSKYITSVEHVKNYGASFFNMINDMFDGNEVPIPLEPPPGEKDAKGKKGAAAAPPPAEAPKDITYFEVDMGARAVRVMNALILSLTDLEDFFNQTNADKVLIAKLSAFMQRAAVFGIEKPGEAQESIGYMLDQDIETILYMCASVMEKFLVRNVENIKVFVTSERMEIMNKVLVTYGPCYGNISQAESLAAMIDPRDFDWLLAPKTDSFGEAILLRPMLLDMLSILVEADSKFREYESVTPFPLEPCVPMPKSAASCEDCSLLCIKTIADVLIGVLLLPVQYGVFDREILQLKVDGSVPIDQLVRIAAIKMLISIGKTSSIGMMALLEGLASKGIGTNWNSSAAEKLFQLLIDYASTADQQIDPTAYAWQRPQFFSDLLPANDAFITSCSALMNNYTIVPFALLASSMLGVITDPRSTPESCILALEALRGFSCQLSQFSAANQPVQYDAFVTAFMGLGGATALAGIIGRYGQIDTKNKQDYLDLLQYMSSRGTVRENHWQEWMVAHKEEVVLDPKTGKPIVRKDDKKKEVPKDAKKDPKAAPATPSLVSDIVLNIESTEEVPDPNRGPNITFWCRLLNSYQSDYRLHTNKTNLLITCTVSQLSDFVPFLLAQQVAVNGADDEQRTALMYALILHDATVIDALLAHQDIDVNQVEANGVPTVNFALYTVASDLIDQYLPGPLADEGQALCTAKSELSSAPIATLGLPSLLYKLLDHRKVDVNVCDKEGNSPLHLAVGLGSMIVYIAGYNFSIRPSAYHTIEYTKESIHGIVRALLDYGLSVNSCNGEGTVALHVASAWGDFDLVQNLISQNCSVNALDHNQRHALHYLFACCPEKTVEIFDLLTSKAVFKPVDQMLFQDYRTGKPENDKCSIELDMFVDSTLQDSLEPPVLTQQRQLYSDIVNLPCMSEQYSLLFILMIGGDLWGSNLFFSEAVIGDKIFRLHTILHVLNQTKEKDCIHLLCDYVTRNNMNILHALTVLCKGETPKVELTDKQKRNKRIKQYPSIELNVIDIILNYTSNLNFHSLCAGAITDMQNWAPLHMAIRNDNVDLVQLILQNSSNEQLVSYMPVHFMSKQRNRVVGKAVAQAVIDRCKDSDDSKYLLNNEVSDESWLFSGTPLHLAVIQRQYEVLSFLCSCHKVDVNTKHPTLQHTALTIACYIQDEQLIRAFHSAKDRLDFAISSFSLGFSEIPLLSVNFDRDNQLYSHMFVPTNVVSCVDVIAQSRNLNILKLLAGMRRNDVIEQLIAEKDYPTGETRTWLIVLEQENDEIVNNLLKDDKYKEFLKVSQLKEEEVLASEDMLEQIVAEEEQGDKNALDVTQDINLAGMDIAQDLEESQGGEGLDVSNEKVTFTIETVPEIEEDEHQSPRPPEATPDNDNTPIQNDDYDCNYTPLAEEERSILVTKLRQSNDLVGFIIDLVNSSGVVTAEYHLSEKYYNNELTTIEM